MKNKKLGVYLFVLVVMLLACSKPHCEYQEDSSCEIYTDGNIDYITVMAKGQHLCCWYATFEGCRYWTPDRIVTEMNDWYTDLKAEHKECLLPEENCGCNWAYGNVIN